MQDCLSKPHALQHPLGIFSQLYLARSFQPYLLQHAIDAVFPVGRSQVVKSGKIVEHFRRGQVVVEVGLLGQVTDVPVHLHVADRLAEDSRAPRRGKDQPRQQLDGSGFTGAVRPDKAKHVAHFHLHA